MPYLPPPAALTPGAIVDAYLRDSGGPRQDTSTDQQRIEIQNYCAEHGLALRNVYVDAAKSGGSTAGRDEFNRLIDSTRRPEDRPAALLLWNYARFARDIDDAIYYKALIRKRGILIHSLTDPIPEGPYGRIVEFFIDVANEEKRRQTSADSRRGLHDLVTRFGCVPGTPPRGFIREPVSLGTRRDGAPRIGHRWRPDPDLVPLIRQAFQMRAAGEPLSHIHTATRLYSTVNSYKAFFSNRIYIGILDFGGETIENYCEPIIDLATWNAVQARLAEATARQRPNARHPRRVNSAYILSGLLYCGQCGAPLNANTTIGGQNRGRSEAYRCSRSKRRAGCTQPRINRARLENAVLATLRDYILQPDSLAALLEVNRVTIQRRDEQRQQRLTALAAERRQVAAYIANLTRAIAEHGHSQALLAKLTELENRQATIRAEITELETLRLEPPPPPLTPEDIAALSDKLITALQTAPPEKIRQILRGFIHRITVKKDAAGNITGDITYFTPPTDGTSPHFDLSPASGDLPIESPSSGPPLYRQIFTHPLIFSCTQRQIRCTPC